MNLPLVDAGSARSGALPRSGTVPSTVRRSLTIVVPARDEEDRLLPTLRNLHDFVSRPTVDGEIIVVDDGSRDGTADLLASCQRAMPLLRVVTHSVNLGKGSAVRSGILAARRDAVLFTDADLSTPIEELDRFWPWFDRGYDVVLASRYMPGSSIEIPQPLHRRVMSGIFRLLTGLAGLRGIRDTQCGFKLFRAATAGRLFSELGTPGYAFDAEVLLRARRRGYRIAQVPVRWLDSPRSRISLWRDPVRMLFDLLRIRARL